MVLVEDCGGTFVYKIAKMYIEYVVYSPFLALSV